MRMLAFAALFLVACGGEEKKPAPTPEAPKATPAATPAPTPAPPPPAVEASGPYTPDDLAKAAVEKAKAAKATDMKNPKAGDAAAIAAGKTNFEAKCVLCHGAAGKGDGVGGAALPQKPANFSWKERWDASTIGEKHWIVMNGIQGTGMTPQGLTDDQAWEVLAYIESSFAPK